MSGKRTDNNHAIIRDGLRELGYPVHDCSRYPGYVDLMAGDKNGRLVLLEVKSAGGKLRESQKLFFALWHCYPVYMVRSLDEALGVLNG